MCKSNQHLSVALASSVTSHSGRYSTSAEVGYWKSLRQKISKQGKTAKVISLKNAVDADEC